MLSPSIIGQYSPERAAKESPSLRTFLKTISDAADGKLTIEEKFPELSPITAALRSGFPKGAIAFRTLDGDAYTAEELADHVSSYTDVGKRYIELLVSASRDAIRRQSARLGV